MECFIIDNKQSNQLQQHPYDIQVLLNKHQNVFSYIPLGRPLDRGFEHVMELEEGVQMVITSTYWHPKVYNDDIEKAIKELLRLGHIRPSSSPFTSLVVMAKKKDGTLQMCIDYWVLNKKQ